MRDVRADLLAGGDRPRDDALDRRRLPALRRHAHGRAGRRTPLQAAPGDRCALSRHRPGTAAVLLAACRAPTSAAVAVLRALTPRARPVEVVDGGHPG